MKNGLKINYNYCRNAYYDVINNICQKVFEIIKKVEDEKMKINYGYIGRPEKIITLKNNESGSNNYLPGVSTREFNESLEYEIQMNNYFRKYIVSIIDRSGQIINVERTKIIKKGNPKEERAEFLYEGKVIQEKGRSNYLLHEGLRNALIIELEKAYKRNSK